MTTYQELIEHANDAVGAFNAENCTCSIEEAIHIEWAIRDAEYMIKKLKELLPEVKRME